MGCRGVFSLTHTLVPEAAKQLGRPPDCSDGCYDGCNSVIFVKFLGKMVIFMIYMEVVMVLVNILS